MTRAEVHAGMPLRRGLDRPRLKTIMSETRDFIPESKAPPSQTPFIDWITQTRPNGVSLRALGVHWLPAACQPQGCQVRGWLVIPTVCQFSASRLVLLSGSPGVEEAAADW